LHFVINRTKIEVEYRFNPTKMEVEIKRNILNDLKNHLIKPEISLITGPRQSGKTTIMFFLQKYLAKKNKKTLYLNLDIEKDKSFFDTQEKLLQKIQIEIGKTGYVFIDEIQRKENAGLFLKGLFDMQKNYKLIVSGSGSLELKEKIHESLAGRKRIFHVQTLSFFEFANFRTNYQYENNLKQYLDTEKEKTIILLNEYLNFGSYPKVVLDETVAEKTMTISEIQKSVLEKDLIQLLNLKKTEQLTDMIKILAHSSGNIINVAKIANDVRLAEKTVNNYLYYFTQTFIVDKIRSYFNNVRKEIVKSPIFYFYDLGFRNYAINLFGNIEQQNMGFIFENFVYNELKNYLRQTNTEIKFWRTKEGAEVDFVLCGNEIIPIEVKCSYFDKPKLSRSFQSFLTRYKPKNAYIVNLDFESDLVFKDSRVKFLPFWKIDTILK
jgi:uncharacterized protein